MKILVTGAAGFIASHLCEKLSSLGYSVYGIDNFNNYYSQKLKRINADEIQKKGVVIFEKDLNDNLDDIFINNYDYIFHLAAQPGISSTTSLEEYVTNNIYATQNLLNAVTKYNTNLKLFVNIATSSVYGKEATVNEDALPKPISYYGVTKLAAEQLVMALQRENKIKACSLRLYSVYGPRERPEKLYTKLIENLFLDKPFPLFEGSLTHQRSFTYVSDIIDGLVAVIGKENIVNGEIINLGTKEVHTTAEGIENTQTIINKKLIIDNKPPRKGDQEKTAAIINKAQNLLNYKPKISFKEGLEKQVEWYKKTLL